MRYQISHHLDLMCAEFLGLSASTHRGRLSRRRPSLFRIGFGERLAVMPFFATPLLPNTFVFLTLTDRVKFVISRIAQLESNPEHTGTRHDRLSSEVLELLAVKMDKLDKSGNTGDWTLPEILINI